jgi:hypothetical protein
VNDLRKNCFCEFDQIIKVDSVWNITKVDSVMALTEVNQYWFCKEILKLNILISQF